MLLIIVRGCDRGFRRLGGSRALATLLRTVGTEVQIVAMLRWGSTGLDVVFGRYGCCQLVYDFK